MPGLVEENRKENEEKEENNMTEDKEEDSADEESGEEVPEWMWDEEASVLPTRELSLTSEQVVRRVYHLARSLARVFHRHGVAYWTSGGTTLGIVRHGGLIPWDDDIDICIREQDLHLLEGGAVVEELAGLGCRVARNKEYSWKVWHAEMSEEVVTSSGKVAHYRFPFCDVFLTSLQRGVWRLRGREGRSAWPEEWYTQEQVEGRAPRVFGNIELSCPGQPQLYLDRTYGEEWRELGATHTFCHQSGAILRSRQFSIAESASFLPATPFH